MCYCNQCKSYFKRPRKGPKERLGDGTPDLGICMSEDGTVRFYYNRRDLFCPGCGALYERLGPFGYANAAIYGDRVSRKTIDRYFEFCRKHPDMTEMRLPGTSFGYPGESMAEKEPNFVACW